jgi:prepilin signal peptidase PulO-like enzyme (type II secretory pathway)
VSNIATVIYGFSTEIWVVILIGQLGLALGLMFVPTSHTLLPDVLIYPSAYLFLIISASSMSKLDEFGIAETQDGSILISLVYLVIRVGSTCVGLLSLGRSHLLASRKEPDPEDPEEQVAEVATQSQVLENLG